MVVSTCKNRSFVKCEPPSDAAIAAVAVLQKISQRVIRTLRRLGYLEEGMDAAVATAYDPLLDNEPELARTMAASVTQRIAFGERAGEKVRRIGSGFGYGDLQDGQPAHGWPPLSGAFTPSRISFR
jgi:hypothetical protein